MKRIRITIQGKPSYERWSIYQWILSFKDLLESEYNIVLDIYMAEGSEEYPVIIIDGNKILDIPFEEGYLLEYLKSCLDKILGIQEHS